MTTSIIVTHIIIALVAGLTVAEAFKTIGRKLGIA